MTIKIPTEGSIKGVKFLVSGEGPNYDLSDGYLNLTIPLILDHEVVAIDFSKIILYLNESIPMRVTYQMIRLLF